MKLVLDLYSDFSHSVCSQHVVKLRQMVQDFKETQFGVKLVHDLTPIMKDADEQGHFGHSAFFVYV